MPNLAGDFTALCRGIALTERRIEAEYERIAACPTDSADAQYARTVLHVLRRSLKLMHVRRDRLKRELNWQRGAGSSQARKKRPPPTRMRIAEGRRHEA
jgi:hypothetical protein